MLHPTSEPAPHQVSYPVMLNMRGRRAVVVGAGPVGTQKINGLLAAGADVTVIAPVLSPAVEALTDRITVHRRRFEDSDFDGTWLVIAASNDSDVQQHIFEEGSRRNIWVNCADEPDRCSFILPAVHREGPITVMVSTGGRSPAMAGWLRTRLAKALPPRSTELIDRVAARRAAIKATGASTEGLAWTDIIEEELRSLEAGS